ncbi:MAG: FAD-binding oxidoreductase [Pseudomonadales bacterium]
MQELIAALKSCCSDKAILNELDLLDRGLPKSVQPGAIVRPANTEELSLILKHCSEVKQTVVPLGGLTGLVNGTDAGQDDLGLSLERMNKIEEIDLTSRTMTVQAGVPLQLVQQAAEAEGMMFPLDLGARGSATIGGNVATNAGGNRVIRYGMLREQILGLEVVLADGTVMSSMNKVIKNNTGYDLKQLFIGSEGTLGIVTRVVLKLRPLPTSQNMAFVGVSSFDQVTHFLTDIERRLGGNVTAFEVMWQDFYKLVTTPPAKGIAPLSQDFPYVILVETMGGDSNADYDNFVAALGAALEGGVIDDAVIASSQGERDAMWAIRDDVHQVAQNAPITTFDVSVPLAHMESYVAELKAALTRAWPDHTCMIFGHLGDSNLHVIVGVGDGSRDTREQVVNAVYAGLPDRGGSISAEHGIGLQKKHHLNLSRNETEIMLMKRLKLAFDPQGILNPGKIFSLNYSV